MEGRQRWGGSLTHPQKRSLSYPQPMIQVRGWVGWAGAYNKGWVGKVTTIQARGGGRGTRTIQGWCQDKKKSGGPGEPHEGKVREHLIYKLYCSYTQIATSTSQIEKSVGSTANHFQVAKQSLLREAKGSFLTVRKRTPDRRQSLQLLVEWWYILSRQTKTSEMQVCPRT